MDVNDQSLWSREYNEKRQRFEEISGSVPEMSI